MNDLPLVNGTPGFNPAEARKSAAVTPTVSVVIVSWNARKYLAECLSSLTPAVCRYPMEIIVVDNASGDGSSDMVQRDFPDVRLIRNFDNFGFAKANNIGIRASAGDYIALVNSDVHVLDGALTRLVDHCRARPEVGIAGPRVIGRDGRLQRSCRGFPSLWNMLARALALDAVFPSSRCFGGYMLNHWGHEESREAEILSGCFWLVRRAALETVGLLDERFFIYGEDMDWCLRFRKAGWRASYLHAAEAIHYGGASSANAPTRFFVEKQRADLQYWQKHHRGPAFLAYFAIGCLHHGVRVVAHNLAAALPGVDRDVELFKARRSAVCLFWMLRGRQGRRRVLAALARQR